MKKKQKVFIKRNGIKTQITINNNMWSYKLISLETSKYVFQSKELSCPCKEVNEFIAIVHGLSYIKKNSISGNVYSNCHIAIEWIKDGISNPPCPIFGDTLRLNAYSYLRLSCKEKYLPNNMKGQGILTRNVFLNN